MNKKLIRKLILEEVEKKLLNEQWQAYAIGAVIVAALGAGALRWYQHEWGSATGKEAVELILTGDSRKNLFNKLESAIDQLNNSGYTVNMPSDEDLETAAKKMEGAVNIEFLGIDYNTNFDDIKSAIQDCGTQVALSKMAYLYFHDLGFEPNIYEELFNERNLDEKKQKSIINRIEAMDFIEITYNGSTRPYTREEFDLLIQQGQSQAPQNTQSPPGTPVASTPSTTAPTTAPIPTPGESPIESEASVEDPDEDKIRAGMNDPDCDNDTPFKAPYVENITRAMNEYATKNGLDEGLGWDTGNPCPVQNSWSNEIQNYWNGYIRYAYANCNIVSQMGLRDAELDNWGMISDALRDQHPRYTRNPKGCLAFVLDTICCKIKYGNIPVRSTPARSTTGRTPSRPDVSIPSAPDSGRRQGSSRITIKLGQGQNNFTNTGFSHSSGQNPDTYLKELIKGFLDRRASASGVRPGTMQFYMYLDNNNKVNRTDATRIGRDLVDTKTFRKRELERQISDFGRGLVFPTNNRYNLSRIDQTFDRGRGRRGRDKPAIFVTVTFTGGRL